MHEPTLPVEGLLLQGVGEALEPVQGAVSEPEGGDPVLPGVDLVEAVPLPVVRRHLHLGGGVAFVQGDCFSYLEHGVPLCRGAGLPNGGVDPREAALADHLLHLEGIIRDLKSAAHLDEGHGGVLHVDVARVGGWVWRHLGQNFLVLACRYKVGIK